MNLPRTGAFFEASIAVLHLLKGIPLILSDSAELHSCEIMSTLNNMSCFYCC